MATSLPLELLLKIFDDLDLQPDLVRASLVCEHWRTAAFSHPVYYKDIYLDGEELDAKPRILAAFMAARLLRAPAAADNLSIVIKTKHDRTTCTVEGSMAVADFSRTALRARLASVRHLEVAYSDIAMRATLAAINSAAPSLTSLVLDPGRQHVSRDFARRYSGGTIPVVANDQRPRGLRLFRNLGFQIFSANRRSATQSRAGSQQSLDVSQLYNGLLRGPRDTLAHMELLSQPSLRFQRVEHLWVQHCKGFSLQIVMRCFPSVRRLGLVACVHRAPFRLDLLSNAAREWISRLDALGTDDYELTKHLVSTGGKPPRNLTVIESSNRPLSHQWTDLFVPWAATNASVGPLEVLATPFIDELHPVAEIMRLSLHHTETGVSFGIRMRARHHTFVHPYSRYRISWEHFELLGERITRISLPESQIQSVFTWSFPLPRLSELEVVINNERFRSRLSWPAQDLELPSLRKIRFAPHPPNPHRMITDDRTTIRILARDITQELLANLVTAGQTAKLVTLEFANRTELWEDPSVRSITLADLRKHYAA
ncbi:hypothetical protein BKA62DRAFT_709943 [Auriculariales sp. MPI-PUGE-AT-0066]|nr:hypothetical protein BKA62DRAFT_709943 [Auriculariales sp. MPI-PUGE-AT-0066]